jgi:outer membrane protein TolC
MNKIIKLNISILVIAISIFPIFNIAEVWAGDKISYQDVLSSSIKHYPDIIAAQNSLESSEQKVIQAEGEYDLYFKTDYYNRVEGFYDGQQVNSLLVKPFQTMNTEVYGGFRHSDGSFPIYDGKMVTNDGGEYLVGFKTSLLKDRDIDKNRVAILDSEFDFDISSQELVLTKLSIQRQALSQYLNWLYKAFEYKIIDELNEIAKNRQQAFVKKFEEGEVAELAVTENKQLLLQRNIELQKAEQEFENASNKLSLFYRDGQGQKIKPNYNNADRDFPEFEISFSEGDIERIIEQRPEVIILQNQINKMRNKVRLGENELATQADLNFEFSNDEGAGSITREEEEVLVKLDFKIPLQRNKGRGMVSSSLAEISKLENKLKITKDKLRVELKNQLHNLKIADNVINLAIEELNTAKEIYEAEKIRFANGDNDFFMLNQREKSLAEAKIKKAQAKFTKNLIISDIYFLTADLESLMIK